ncbi:hypothetical protein Dda_5733 [Drechslerella dactyloides]|uniref:Uncharacterized protein n=1 Tax=Drechslerella dactyloides TaxID=74499 RepID=A0AAD6IXC7_DREDA|nr:hypothetical protein Dda_5733 [Drechslerella dactyloides]
MSTRPQFDTELPRPPSYRVVDPIKNTFLHPLRRALYFLSYLFNKPYTSWGYKLITQSPSLSVRGPGKGRRHILLALYSLCGIILLYSFISIDGKTLLNLSEPFDDTGWDRDKVIKLLGSEYFLGEIVSGHEWSTFEFGSKTIPTPPPEPPGAFVIDVIPPSEWLNCPAAQDLVRLLPEVTFVSIAEALTHNLDDQDLG